MVCRLAFSAAAAGTPALTYFMLLAPEPRPPKLTELATRRWPRDVAVQPEHVAAFDRDGFVVLRRVLEPEVVDMLRREVRSLCILKVLLEGACQLESTRWRSDTLRDFQLHGPLARVAQIFIRGKGVRIKQDGVFGLRRGLLRRPSLFSYKPHVDHSGHVGIFGGLHSNSSGAAVWVPLQDIDPEKDGGSVYVHRGFPSNPAKVFMDIKETRARRYNATFLQSQVPQIEQGQTVLRLRRGDVVVWHPDMLHHSQAVLSHFSIRYAWYARMVDADAAICMYTCDPPETGLPTPCCRIGIGPGDKIHSPCFPQANTWHPASGLLAPLVVYPGLLEQELAAHLEPRPTPMISAFEGQVPGDRWRYWREADMTEECKAPWLSHQWVT